MSEGVSRAAIYVNAGEPGVRPVVSAHRLDSCRALAHEQGWRLVGEYVDQRAAQSVRERLSYVSLVEDIQAGQIDVVVAAEPSQLHRDLPHLEDYLRVCQDAKVSTWFANGDPYWEPGDHDAARCALICNLRWGTPMAYQKRPSVHVRLDELLDPVDAWASANRVSRGDAIRTAVRRLVGLEVS